MAKVVRFHELGGPEVLRLEEITFEDPAPGELRLKVGAIGLNRREVVYRSGGFGAPNKYPAALSGQSPQHNASVTSVV
jgi:NADPH:quinone reductase-like Zn-dependent oxidoreductase